MPGTVQIKEEGKGESSTLRSVRRARKVAQGLLVAIYLGSMLSLDYGFKAIKGQNFVRILLVMVSAGLSLSLPPSLLQL
eukprot:467964-Hanusia_phi.AAC.1